MLAAQRHCCFYGSCSAFTVRSLPEMIRVFETSEISYSLRKVSSLTISHLVIYQTGPVFSVKPFGVSPTQDNVISEFALCAVFISTIFINLHSLLMTDIFTLKFSL